MSNRQTLRRQLRQQRRDYPAHLQRQAACSAARVLSHWPQFARVRRLALYFAADGELDPAPLLQLVCRRNIQCYFPVLYPVAHQQRLWFAPWKPGEPLQTNAYGIPEPIWRPARLLKPWALDMVITPLVGFSSAGYRIGMGGGYYDRSFAWRRHRQHWKKPLLVGYAYAFQHIAHLRPQPWDVRLDAIVCETGVQIPQ